MRDHQELLGLLIRQLRDHAVILMDVDGRVVAWLGAAQHIMGYSPEEMVGRKLDVIFSPDDQRRGIPAQELLVAAANGRSENDRWQVRKDGSRYWSSGSVIALRDEAGNIVGYGKIMRDRTEIKTQLETAERRAEAVAKADQRKGIFLATLAHELRNPLAPLKNALELLRLPGLKHAALEFPIQIIERQLDSLRRLVDDLLDVTRLGAGKVRIQPEPLDLHALLSDEVQSAAPAAKEKGQEIRLLAPEALIVVDADAARLRQVFSNLLTNAIKYSPESGKIWVKLTVEAEEAVVRVEDNGIGISSEMLPRIFELFTQEEASLPNSQGGLGLGLPLVKELVTLHGGSVQVRSEGRGKGSEFTVRLPLRRPAKTDNPHPTTPVETDQ